MLLKLTPALYFLNCILTDLREHEYRVQEDTQITITDGPAVVLKFEVNNFGIERKFEVGFQDTLREESRNTLHVVVSQRVADSESSLKDFEKSYSWEFYIHEGWSFDPLETMAEQLLAAALEFLQFASVPEHFNPTQ